MGMAASQARFLNLTARKTNIEFEGAQINQQRTALSNESANLYNQMLSLQVPTPPNTQDYTKIEYTFMMPGGNDEANISQIIPITSGTNKGKFTVTFSYKTVELGFPACADDQKPAVDSSTHSITRPVPEGKSGSPETYNTYRITTSSGKAYDLYKYNSSWDSEIHGDVNTALAKDGFGDLYFVNVGTEALPKYQYYSGAELAKCVGTTKTQSVATYYTAADVETYKEDRYTPCTLSRDTQNRVQSFTVTPTGGTATTFAVTTSTVTDEAAYNDAMNEYTYKSYLYEQEMNNINAKSSIIHAQDRELELKLKQLDTEHNAVQTEIETVQSVCKKNVEDSFKTFA